MMTLLLTLAVLMIAGWGVSRALEPTPIGPAVAPDPDRYSDAVVQVYGANVWGVRGRFAIHTWIATKQKDAEHYTLYHVLGWRAMRDQSVVSIDTGVPNQKWFGSEPMLLHEVRGERARALVADIDRAARDYPHPDEYTMGPGPNSNSFIEWIALSVPALALELPAKALGKNWMKANFSKYARDSESRQAIAARTPT